ncbi:MAG TPA: Wzz/FepE/Etk N-terminal domain-containing protein [Chitinophagaceae bacterium]|jgi:hypothetical protein
MSEAQQEISLKDLVQKIKGLINYLFTKWIWICVAGLVFGSIALIYVWLSKPKYTAEVSFILSNNSQNNGSFFSIASQFGINLGSGNTDAFSGDNIISLMNSRIMVQKALLEKPPGQNETLVNILVKELEMDEGWNGNDRTKGAYPFPMDDSKMSYVQDSLFRSVYEMVRDNFLEVSRPDDNQAVYIVSTTSTNEIFSLYLTKFLVESTSKFYIDTKTSVAKSNLDMLQHEADSLRSLLSASISSTARVYDYTFNLNPALQSQRAPAQEGQLRVTVLGTAYGEVLKNLELAKINLQQQTPLYQILDEPHLPLRAEKTSRLIALIFGGFTGGFLVICFLLGRKIFIGLWY